MELENRILRLIAVGASITANCQPCLQINVARAVEAGATQQEIAEAITVGKMVRKGAASKMDNFAAGLESIAEHHAGALDPACGCDS